MRERDLRLAKGFLVGIGSALVAVALHHARDSQLALPLAAVTGLILVGGVVVAYELGARGIAWILGKILPYGPLPERDPEEGPRPAPEGASDAAPLGAKQALGLVAVFIGAQVVVWLALGVAAGINQPSASPAALQVTTLRLVPLGILVGYLFATVAVVLLFQWYARGADHAAVLRQVGWGVGSRRQVVVAGVIGAAIALAYSALALLGVGPHLTEHSLDLLARTARQPGFGRDSWAVVAIVLAPPIEELLFRGGLLAGLEHSWGPTIAAVTVTIAFVAIHLPETVHYWPGTLAVTVFAVGALLARRASGYLGPAVSMHLGYNVVIVGFAFAAAPRAG